MYIVLTEGSARPHDQSRPSSVTARQWEPRQEGTADRLVVKERGGLLVKRKGVCVCGGSGEFTGGSRGWVSS